MTVSERITFTHFTQTRCILTTPTQQNSKRAGFLFPLIKQTDEPIGMWLRSGLQFCKCGGKKWGKMYDYICVIPIRTFGVTRKQHALECHVVFNTFLSSKHGRSSTLENASAISSGYIQTFRPKLQLRPAHTNHGCSGKVLLHIRLAVGSCLITVMKWPKRY